MTTTSLGRDTPPMINLYQYVSPEYRVNKNAFFYNYLYSTDSALADDPENKVGWRPSTFSGVRVDGAVCSVPQITVQQFVDYNLYATDGITPVFAYTYRPYVDGTFNVPATLLCASTWRFQPQYQPPYLVEAWKPRSLSSVASEAGTGWPYQEGMRIGSAARLAFFAYREPGEDRIPVYQYAYRDIWNPSYWVYSTSKLDFNGTGLWPAPTGPGVSVDGNDTIAFYACLPM